MDNNSAQPMQPTVITPDGTYQQPSMTPTPKKNHTALIIFIIVIILLSAGVTLFILFNPLNQTSQIETSPVLIVNQIEKKASATPSASLISTNSASMTSTPSASATSSALPKLKASPSSVASATPVL